MATYRLSGHLIESSIPLHAFAAPMLGAMRPPDITVTCRAEAAERELPCDALRNRVEVGGEPVLSMALVAGQPLLRVHGFADFLIDPSGLAVECTPAPGCAPSALAQVVVDRLLPHVLAYRGVPALHASAVAPRRGGAAAFVGDPGSGKSTIAGALCPPLLLLCDDCAVLEIRSAGTVVQPSYPLVRLRRDAAARLAPGASDMARSPQRTAKWRCTRPAAEGPVPLVKIYALARDTSGSSLEDVRPRDAVAELARHLFRLDPTDRARLAKELAVLEHLASTVAVARLRYRPGLDALDETTKLVRRDLGAVAVEPVDED